MLCFLNKSMIRTIQFHGPSLSSKPSLQSEDIINFLEIYFAKNGDYMQNSNILHLTVLCKSNADEIRRITRIFDENKRTFVWSYISTIFRETYYLRDDDISPHTAIFRAKFHSTSQLCQRNIVALSDISNELSFVVSDFSLALNDSFILFRFISCTCKQSCNEA